MALLINKAGKQFGSDVYTHYTAVYTWNSNQMAHAMMGFAGTTLFMHAAMRLCLEFWYGALFYAIPFLKDMTDVIADRSASTSQFKMKAAHRCEIWLDAVTDNFFWAAGLTLALFVMVVSYGGQPWWAWVVILTMILLFTTGIFVARRHFNKQKRQFDISGLPYYFRLPCYSGTLVTDPDSDSTKRGPVEEVESFAYKECENASHLLLYGPPRSFKTTLAVAIGSGLSVRRQAVRYLSKARLIEEHAAATSDGDTATVPISLHKADILIVDDLDQPDGLKDILPTLAEKSTVWVVSSSSKTKVDEWMRVFRDGLNDPPVTIELESCQERRKNLPLHVNVIALITLLVSFFSIIGALVLLLVP